jgi:NADH:ubiquinone oxidoreductase subunit 6 (subunit J)
MVPVLMTSIVILTAVSLIVIFFPNADSNNNVPPDAPTKTIPNVIGSNFFTPFFFVFYNVWSFAYLMPVMRNLMTLFLYLNIIKGKGYKYRTIN